MIGLRDRLCKGFLLAAFWAAPSKMRPIIGYISKALAGIPEQIERGQSGGVMITPWFISEDGSRLAHTQAVACGEEAARVREWHAANPFKAS